MKSIFEDFEYDAIDYIKSKFNDLSGEYYSKNNVTLDGIFIKEAIGIYSDIVASYGEIRNECFEKYNGIEAVYKVCEKKPEYLKAKTEALKLIYQIYKDLNNEIKK